MNSPAMLQATYFGFVETTFDALILFEACLDGKINHVARRPHDRERDSVIRSGQVFIYEEHSSGIKRWTDGISWSPSRILHNFLIYRQLVRAFASGEKKKALKKPKSGPSGVQKNQSNSRRSSMYPEMLNHGVPTPVPSGYSTTYADLGITLERERQLIGSLTDSYDFLDDGLVKKTISVDFGGVTHHLVSYYNVQDAADENLLMRPSKDPKFSTIRPRHDLMHGQNFRSPIDDEIVDHSTGYSQNRYDPTNQSLLALGNHMPMMSGPEVHSGFPAPGAMYNGSYATPATSAPYVNGGLAYSTGTTYGQYAPSPGIYNVTQRNEAYTGDPYRRYSSTNSLDSTGSRAPMPVLPPANRRAPSYSQSEDTVAAPEISRFSNGSMYNQGQINGYYPSRDHAPANTASTLSLTTQAQRLPVPPGPDYARQAGYDRLAAPSYRTGIDSRDAWAMNGNASIGHAHYQHPAHWASASSASQ